jgi:hypothetical protein
VATVGKGPTLLLFFRFDLGQYGESRVLLEKLSFLLILRDDGELQCCAGKITITVVVRGIQFGMRKFYRVALSIPGGSRTKFGRRPRVQLEARRKRNAFPPPSYGFQQAVDLKGGSNASARYHDDERCHGLSGH